VRSNVGMYDMTSFGKLRVEGRDAESLLNHVCGADMSVPVGKIVYTQFLNPRGGIEADVTIIRRGPDLFWLITGSGLGVRDRDWITRNIGNFDVQLRDITSGYGVINLTGPLARKVLEKVTHSDVRNAGFPFMTAQDIRIGYAPVTAYRVTYVGELGWELYIPTEYVAYVFEVLQ